MKTTFASIAILALGATSALGALAPQPTPHAHMVKRQKFPDGINVSAMLADPSKYVAEVSSALNDPKHGEKNAREYSSLTANPKFQSSLSKELVDEFGTKTGQEAISQYKSFLNALDASSSKAAAAASSKAAAAAAASASTTATASEYVDDANASVSQTLASASQTGNAKSQIVGAATSGASSDLAKANMAIVAAAVAGALAVAAF